MEILNKRLTRRDLIKLAAAAGLAGTGLTSAAGCQPSSPAPSPTSVKPATQAPAATPGAPAASAATAPATSAPTVKRGGSLRVAVQTDFETMWPMTSTNGSPWDAFDTLFNWGQDEKGTWIVKPGLVESWEMSDKKAIFKVRKGIKFHDGSDLDAEVVRWNLDVMRNHKLSVMKADLAVIDPKNPAQVLDKYTVQVNLTSPSASLLNMLADWRYSPRIVSKAAYDKLGEEGLAKQAVGTGPFKVTKWESGSQLVVKRFEDAWEKGIDGKPLPYLDEVVYRFVPNDSTRMLEVRTGNADFTDLVQAKDVAAVKADSNLVYIENPSVSSAYSFFFNSKSAPFGDNVKLRQAVQHAINREAIAKAVGMGLGTAMKSHFPKGIVGYDESAPYYWYEPDKAKQLVKDAGFPNGVDVKLSIVAREIEQQQAEMMKQMLDAVGIRTTIESLEQVAWSDKVLKARNFQLATQRSSSQPDADRIMTLYWGGSPDVESSYTGAVIPELNQLALQARSTYDDKKRQELYVQIQKIMYDSSWWGYLWMQPRNYVMTKRLRNFQKDVWSTFMRERDAWLDS